MENSAAAAAARPRLTRAAAKRSAVVTAVAVAAKRKRVALSQLPTLPNAVLGAHDDDDDKPVRKQRPLPAAKPKPKPKAAPAPAAPAAADDTDDDIQLCKPYASDIYSYLRSMESQAKRRLAVDYIAAVQIDVTPNMRGILIDWLVEVAEEYKLVSDTLYLTVSYIDRFLSAKVLNRQKLQLLGVSAMLIAS
jgi:cyclin-A